MHSQAVRKHRRTQAHHHITSLPMVSLETLMAVSRVSVSIETHTRHLSDLTSVMQAIPALDFVSGAALAITQIE